MKAFLFSLLVFFALLGLIIGNSFFVKSVALTVQDHLDALENIELARERLPILQEYWKKNERLLEFSIPSDDLHEIANRLVEMNAALLLEDNLAFVTARDLCLESIVRIENLERFSLLYIL